MFQMKRNGNSGIPLWFPNLTCRWDQCVSVAAFRAKPNLEQRQSDRLFFHADKIGSEGFIFNSQRLLTKNKGAEKRDTWRCPGRSWCSLKSRKGDRVSHDTRQLGPCSGRWCCGSGDCSRRARWSSVGLKTSHQISQSKQKKWRTTVPAPTGPVLIQGLGCQILTLWISCCITCGEFSGPGSMTSPSMLIVSVVAVPCCSLSTF